VFGGNILVFEGSRLGLRLGENPGSGGGKVNLRRLSVDFGGLGRQGFGGGKDLPLIGPDLFDDGQRDSPLLAQQGKEDVFDFNLGMIPLLGDGGSLVQGLLGFKREFFVIQNYIRFEIFRPRRRNLPAFCKGTFSITYEKNPAKGKFSF
jgi:hypothetical protein